MFHARLFAEQGKARDSYIQPTRTGLRDLDQAKKDKPWLDGNPDTDRPLIVQFCANDPDKLLAAAQLVEPFCDAVDLNLGCPQGIAKKGNYGAFLQEDWELIYRLINKLHNHLSIPVTAKFRILETREKTLKYAKTILSAGASIITVHGRRREQKSQNTGIADWSMVRYLRDNLPPDTVIFSNGNILNHGDLEQCLKITGADGIMSAEGNLSDPTIFAEPPPVEEETREYWRGNDGQEGYRIDAVMRRYLDIIYRDILEQEPPQRKPLFIPGYEEADTEDATTQPEESEGEGGPPQKKQKRDREPKPNSPNLRFMQGHLFQLFRPFVGTYTHIRDALSRSRVGDMAAFEHVLDLLEKQVREALLEDAKATQTQQETSAETRSATTQEGTELTPEQQSFRETIAKYKRPWFICQPFIRPLPAEAIKNGSLQVSKKELAKLERERQEKVEAGASIPPMSLESQALRISGEGQRVDASTKSELPKEAAVCG